MASEEIKLTGTDIIRNNIASMVGGVSNTENNEIVNEALQCFTINNQDENEQVTVNLQDSLGSFHELMETKGIEIDDTKYMNFSNELYKIAQSDNQDGLSAKDLETTYTFVAPSSKTESTEQNTAQASDETKGMPECYKGSAAKNGKIKQDENGQYYINVEPWDDNGDSLNCVSRIIRNVYGVSLYSKEGKDVYNKLREQNSNVFLNEDPDSYYIYDNDRINLVDINAGSEKTEETKNTAENAKTAAESQNDTTAQTTQNKKNTLSIEEYFDQNLTQYIDKKTGKITDAEGLMNALATERDMKPDDYVELAKVYEKKCNKYFIRQIIANDEEGGIDCTSEITTKFLLSASAGNEDAKKELSYTVTACTDSKNKEKYQYAKFFTDFINYAVNNLNNTDILKTIIKNAAQDTDLSSFKNELKTLIDKSLYDEATKTKLKNALNNVN